jgi:hypothetical protein
MTVPNRTITPLDGGNGVSVASGVVRAMIGVSSTGTVDSPSAHTSGDDVGEVYGVGPLVNAAKYELDAGGGTLIVCRTEDTVAGSYSEGKHDQDATATGDCDIESSSVPNDKYRICVEILSTGAGDGNDLTAATFRYSLDAGPDDADDEYKTWSLPITVPDTQAPATGQYEIPNTGVTLEFSDGGSAAATDFIDGDKFYFQTTAPAFQLADMQDSFDAIKEYVASLGAGAKCSWVEVVGEVTATLALAAQTELDGHEDENQFRAVICQAADVTAISAVVKDDPGSPAVTVAGLPQGSYNVLVTIPGAGALGVMTFTYSLDGGKTTSDAITSAAGGTYIIPGTGIELTFAAGPYAGTESYTFTTMDSAGSLATWRAGLITDYIDCDGVRLVVCAGFGEATHPDGKIRRTPLAWGMSALAAKVGEAGMSTDLGQVQDAGRIPNFININHDESKNPGLDDAGFCTARKWTGYAGVYINQPRIMAPAGSDFDLWQYRRVMDEACRVLDVALIRTVNRKVRVDAVTGYIDERDAVALDQRFTTVVGQAIVSPGHAVSAQAVIRRNEALLSTRRATVDVSIIGMAYLKTLNANVGFKNPALVAV